LLEQRRHLATHLDGTLREHVTELGEQSPQAVDRRGALLDEPLSRTVQAQVGLLLEALHRYEPHAGAADRLADRLGVVAVVLAALAVGRDEFRCHQPHPVPEPGKSPRPVVRAGARLHPDQARWELRDELEQLRAPDAPPQHHGASGVDTVHGKYVLCQIDPHGSNFGHGTSPLAVIEHAHTRQSWHFDAVSGRGSPLHSLGRIMAASKHRTRRLACHSS